MNLDHLDELLQYVPEPVLDAYSKGKNPRAVPPWAAAAALSEKVASKEANGLAQGAAQGPQPSVMDQLRQKAAALNTQAQMQQSPGGLPGMLPQPRMQPQAEPDVQMAASGGLMGMPVRSEMFGMAGGGIVSFDGGGMPADKANYETPYDRLNREANESGTRFGDPKDIEGIGKALVAAGYPLAAISDMLALPINAVRRMVRNPLDKSAPPSLTPALDLRERALNLPKNAAAAADTGSKAIPISVDRPPSSLSAGESAKQAEYARLIKQGMPPEMALKVAGINTNTPQPGLPGMLQQRPPVGGPGAGGPRPGGPGAGPGAGGLPNALDTYNKDPAVAFARQYLSEAPTLPAVTKDFGEYQQQQEAKLRQAGVKPGEAPWELAQKDMAEIQARRAKEDAAREKTKQGRAWDELMEFSSGLTGSSYGAGMARGSKASRELRQKFQADDEAYNKMRDEQDTKLKEMNRLAMGAKFDLANGRIKEHDQKLAERDKLMMEYRKGQATLAGSLSTGAATAAAADQTAAGQRFAAQLQAITSKEANTRADKRLQVDSLKALESNLLTEMNKYGTVLAADKKQRAALQPQLDDIRRALAAVGGYTMPTTPGAGSPGGAKFLGYEK